MKFRKLTENDLREENLPLECWFGYKKRSIKKNRWSYDTRGAHMTNNVDYMLSNYQVEVKENNFAWAVDRINNGKEVRRSTWAKDYYYMLKISKDGSVKDIYSSDNVPANISLEEITATDWELYEEKPKTEVVEFFQIIGHKRFYSDCGLEINGSKNIKKCRLNADHKLKSGVSIKLEINRAELKVIKEVEK